MGLYRASSSQVQDRYHRLLGVEQRGELALDPVASGDHRRRHQYDPDAGQRNAAVDSANDIAPETDAEVIHPDFRAKLCQFPMKLTGQEEVRRGMREKHIMRTLSNVSRDALADRVEKGSLRCRYLGPDVGRSRCHARAAARDLPQPGLGTRTLAF